MSNYYPEHVYFQSQPSSSAIAQSSLRRCSVKGCGKDLPQEYALKMCDDCRGRHRKYATTKRAKRKQEKAAVGAQRIGNDDGRVVTWMPPDHHVSLGPIPDDLDPVTNMHVSQIDPRLFNPTSSELAGALTLPPLDSSGDPEDAYNPTSAQIDETEPPSSAARPVVQSRYCSVKGCRSLIGGEYLFKMCVPCRNRYRGYGMTKRSKWKRGREIAAQELERVRVEEDARRARQGLPLISQLQASDRRAWERKVSETIPRPPVVQYAPISMLPVRMCTVSHCHTVLQGHYPYRRCERHRLQNRHHSKLKRVRDKEVKSTPLRREGTLNPESLGNGSRKGKARAIEPLYTTLNLDPHDLETDEAMSETEEIPDEIPDESSIPPPARGARRSNTVCSVKWCHNVLDYRSPWKMCETHREKDRMNRKRKSDRDKGFAGDVNEEVAGQVVEHANMATDVVESITEPSGLVLETSTPAPDQPIIFMEPLLPPTLPSTETLPSIMPQQSEMSEYVPPRDSPLLSYESAIPSADVTVDTADLGELDIETSSQRSITEDASAEDLCPRNQDVSVHGQQDTPSVVWRSAMSPMSSARGSDSTSSSSDAHSGVTVANTASSPTISTVSTAASSTSTSTTTAHIQPQQFQVPYYMPPPFSLPYTPGQPPFLITGPYSPMPYPLRPSYTYGTPASGPFQAYQYAPTPPPPGQLAPYALRPYPYPAWAPYANGSLEANWFDASAQAHVQIQTQVQTKSLRTKRGWVADQLAPGEDGLRIVMVQPRGINDIDITSPANPSVSESRPPRPSQTVPESSVDCSPQSSSEASPATAASAPAVSTLFTVLIVTTLTVLPFQRSCSCRRQIPAEAPGTLCERCKIRLKRRLEQTKRRLKLEPRKIRAQAQRLMT
ncbi:hypothetical protein EDB83DRAFT_2438409 [Lactarius deliciosus]|nr:hypothetical protein EDB83DRAFT_2438409 [Lactarius deliciosus]